MKMTSNKSDSTTLLYGPEDNLESRIKSVLIDASKIRVAVAYWGAGSSDRLQLGNLAGRDVLIVCDLTSGACNPHEIKRLQEKIGKANVRTLDGLHAKVWLTEKAAIVGSSNASSNGLGFEGNEVKGLIEANVYCKEVSLLASLGKWFEAEVLLKSRDIRRRDFEEAKKRWGHHRITRPELKAKNSRKSILDVLKEQPDALADRNILVWTCHAGHIGKWATRKIETAKEVYKNQNLSGWEDFKGPRPPDGAIVIEFELSEHRKMKRARLDAIWQVLEDGFREEGQKNILLCKPVNRILGFPLGNKRVWEEAVAHAVGDEDDLVKWTLEDFAAKFLYPAT